MFYLAMKRALYVAVDSNPAHITHALIASRGMLFAVHAWLVARMAEPAIITPAVGRAGGVVTHAVVIAVWVTSAVGLLASQACPTRVTCTPVGTAVTSTSPTAVESVEARAPRDVTQPALPPCAIVTLA